MRACMHMHRCVYLCVLKSRCSSSQEATLQAKESVYFVSCSGVVNAIQYTEYCNARGTCQIVAKSEYLTFPGVQSCYRTSLRSYSKRTTSTDW